MYKNRSGQERGDPRIIPPLKNRSFESVHLLSANLTCTLTISDIGFHPMFLCFDWSWPDHAVCNRCCYKTVDSATHASPNSFPVLSCSLAVR